MIKKVINYFTKTDKVMKLVFKSKINKIFNY